MMKTSELFEKEIALIKNSHIKEIVRRTLDLAPEAIQTVPASSSGKYHPAYALGECGLVRHIKATVYIAKSLMETDIYTKFFKSGIVSISREMNDDATYAALILHDCCKPDDTPEHYTRFNHPILASELLQSVADKYIKEVNIAVSQKHEIKWQIERIANAIASHMGQWNTSKYSDIILPTPNTNLEWFVHTCDYLASRRFLEVDFDKV